jgi:hypothetical protein
MENKVDYTFYRDTISSHAGRPITDKEWSIVSSELENALDYYFNEELLRVWDNIEYLVEQYE